MQGCFDCAARPPSRSTPSAQHDRNRDQDIAPRIVILSEAGRRAIAILPAQSKYPYPHPTASSFRQEANLLNLQHFLLFPLAHLFHLLDLVISQLLDLVER